MTRKEFLKVCAALGVSLPLPTLLSSCESENMGPATFTGKVLIIGAGPAGMSTAYLLNQYGIEFQILEADTTYGGRIRRNNTFTDFPIPLGAEWLHVAETELPRIVNDDAVQVTTQLKRYEGEDQAAFFTNGELEYYSLASAREDLLDSKFIGSSWFDFFDEYIVPSIKSNMTFNTEVVSIDYQGDQVLVKDKQGGSYTADKVVVSVPLKILQEGVITFTPALSNTKQNAIEDAKVWSGIKVFLEFTEQFYPVYLGFSDSETSSGQRIYYDAAYGQNTSSHILGLFAVGTQAEVYQAYSGDALRDYILNELDEVFEGKASATYVKHLVQNWNDEPFARAAYLEDGAATRISRRLATSIDDKVYFAGDAYTQEDDWSSVHMAARSAKDAVEELVR